MSLMNVRDEQIGVPYQNAHGHPGTEVGSLYSMIEVDTNNASLTPVDLFNVTYNKKTADSSLRVNFQSSSLDDTGGAGIKFQLLIDGVAVMGCGNRAPTAIGANNNFGQAAGMQHVSYGLPAGNHTVQVQWFVTAGTGHIRPLTHPDDESASLFIQEVWES